MVKNGVEEIGEEEFEKVIQNDLCVVDFFADWCMPCIMMSPILEDLHEKMKDIKFVKVNVDDNSELARKFKIMSIPCIVFFKRGKEIDRLVGGVPQDILEEKIKSLK